jgi:hypothetical protein
MHEQQRALVRGTRCAQSRAEGIVGHDAVLDEQQQSRQGEVVRREGQRAGAAMLRRREPRRRDLAAMRRLTAGQIDRGLEIDDPHLSVRGDHHLVGRQVDEEHTSGVHRFDGRDQLDAQSLPETPWLVGPAGLAGQFQQDAGDHPPQRLAVELFESHEGMAVLLELLHHPRHAAGVRQPPHHLRLVQDAVERVAPVTVDGDVGATLLQHDTLITDKIRRQVGPALVGMFER